MTESDIRYDTAAFRVWAASLAAAFEELRKGGMDRKEALLVVLELVRTINGKPPEPKP